ncbi:MAG: BPSL0067 family protein, partial [Isosphaerales bacterium]
MRYFNPRFLAVLSGLMVVLMASVTGHGHDGPVDPYAVASRPFRSLGELLEKINDQYTQLGQDLKALRKDKARLDDASQKLDAETAQIDNDERALQARSQQAAGAGFRVQGMGDIIRDGYHMISHPYKDFATFEEATAWKGSRGYIMDKSTGQTVTSPPPKPNMDAIRKDETRLGERKRLAGRQRASLDAATKRYTADVNDYNGRNDALSQTTRSLPDPAKALDETRLVFDENAPKALKPGEYASAKKVLDKWQSYLLDRKSIGSGECVALGQDMYGIGPHTEWKFGQKVTSGDKPVTGLPPVGTNVDGKYPNYPTGNHVGGLVDTQKKGVVLFDQFQGALPGFRYYPRQGGLNDPKNQALIQQGAADAARQGLTPDNGKPYYRVLYGHYNPGKDAAAI